MNNLPTAWTGFARRLMQAADGVFKQSGADAVSQPAYFLVDSKGVPLVWVIAQGERLREPQAKRQKEWGDVHRHVADKASDLLSSNKDGCAIAAISATFSREKALLDWRITAMYRVEPSNAAVSVLQGLMGAA